MERGGRGRGDPGPSGHGSSLPDVLRDKMLSGSREQGGEVYEEPQSMTEEESTHQGDILYAASTSYPTRQAASLHPPSIAPSIFEQGSSRDFANIPQLRAPTSSYTRPVAVGESRPQPPYPPLPPIQQRPLPEPAHYSLPVPGNFYGQQPPPHSYSRTPPAVHSLQRETHAGPSSSESRYRGFSSDLSSWATPVGRAAQLQQQRAYYSQSQSYVQDSAEGDRAFREALARSSWGTRQEDISSDLSRNTASHLSAARSTITPESYFHRTQEQYPPQSSSSAGPSGPSRYPIHEQPAHIEPFYSQGGQYTASYSQPPPPLVHTPPPRASTESSYDRGAHLPPPRLEPPRPAYRLTSPFAGYTQYDPSGGRDIQQQHHQPELEREESPLPPPPPPASATSSRKRKARDDSDDDDDEQARPRKITKKTQIACFFCRGRKLKCDGQFPICGNCQKRGLSCTYAPFAKRRGPGKAPKGQKKLAALKAKASATQPAEASQPSGVPSSSTFAPELRPRASVETLPQYNLQPSPETHFSFSGPSVFERSEPQPPPYVPAATEYRQNFTYPTSFDPSQGGGRVDSSPQLEYLEHASTPEPAPYGRAYAPQRQPSGLYPQSQYPPAHEMARGAGPSTHEGWGSAPPTSTTSAMPRSMSRDEPYEEGRSSEPLHEYHHDTERHTPAGLSGLPPSHEQSPQR